MRKQKKHLVAIGMFVVLGASIYGIVRQVGNTQGNQSVETTLVANNPATEGKTEAEKVTNEMSSSSLSDTADLVVEENKTRSPWLKQKPMEKAIYKDNKETGTYGYVQIKKDKLIGMSREEYHDFINQISKYSYDYFTVSFDDGTGLVYHPSYTYWGIYCYLDNDYYIKSVIHYVDAADDEVEIVTEDTKNEVKSFMTEVTKEYRKNGWYKLDVEFLYDNIYQVDLKINIKSDDFNAAKAAIRDIEQKSKAKGYLLNFKITCMNNYKEIVTMTFGDGSPKYTYVENRHRIVLDSLD